MNKPNDLELDLESPLKVAANMITRIQVSSKVLTTSSDLDLIVIPYDHLEYIRRYLEAAHRNKAASNTMDVILTAFSQLNMPCVTEEHIRDVFDDPDDW